MLTFSYTLRCSTLPDEISELRFGVVDVGQGLSQIGIYEKDAIVWDVGPPEGFEEWVNVYKIANKPDIVSIVISHSDRDHAGALSMITEDIHWSGTLIVSSYEDTLLLKSMLKLWRKPIVFKVIAQNDTLMLGENVIIQCLWPPYGLPFEKPLKDPNQYCLVFKVVHNLNTVLISSDLDSANLGIIAQKYNSSLQSDIFIVPHHGSKNSYSFSFFGYTAPKYAVISYGSNTFGHPSPSVNSLLLSIESEIVFTAVSGTCFFSSNGLYWSQSW